MSIKIKCPHCGQKYNLPDEEIGADIICEVCNNTFSTSNLAVPEIEESPIIPEEPPESRMMTVCSICGGAISINAATCPHCGNPRKSGNGVTAPSAGSSKNGKSLKKWLLGCIASNGGFKNPLLGEIFYYAGFVQLIVAIVCVVIMICLAVISADKGIWGIVPALIAFAGAIASAIFNFGIAQIIYCIGRTCYNTDRIVDLLQAKIGDGKQS